MTFDNINLEESIQEVEDLLKKEKVSPAMKSSIKVILLLVKILVNRLGLNSKNSSKPPSTDPNREKKSKKATGRKPGGQKGRKGVTLHPVEDPDEVKEIPVDRSKLPEGKYESVGYESRQVFDFDFIIKVVEYRAEILRDKEGNRVVAEFPTEVTNSVQYGNGVKAHSVYLSQYHLLPVERTREYFSDQLGLPLSAGSICNWNQKAFEKLESFEEKLKIQLRQESLLHSDETGININGKRRWLHGCSNEKWTYLYPHEKRGTEAMDEMGVLPYYKGRLCHDHWKSYYKYREIIHALCNAHHLRELTSVWEQDEQRWGKEMREFLLETNEEVERAGGMLEKERSEKKREKFREILKRAETECPAPALPPEPLPGDKKKRGRLKRTKARNLLERLQKYENDVLLFMLDKNVPFTNNLGERDIRMTKVQQKISGCFRSIDGAKTFCRIRSYLSSAKKQNISASSALNALFAGEDVFEKLWR
jgi:transposase